MSEVDVRAADTILTLDDYRDDNQFELGAAGGGGLGGSGGVPAAAGSDGVSTTVVVQ